MAERHRIFPSSPREGASILRHPDAPSREMQFGSAVPLDDLSVAHLRGFHEEHQPMRSLVSSSLGVFNDLYYLSLMNLTKDLIGASRGWPLTLSEKSRLGSTIFAGTVLGQLIFGLSSDKLGRRAVCIVTSFLMFFGAIGSACAFENRYWSLVSMLSVFQCILGLGIGGEYPLTASMTSESSSPTTSGMRGAIVAAMMSLGSIMAPLGIWIMLECGVPDSVAWRVSLLLGCLTCLFVAALRLHMVESRRFAAARVIAGHTNITQHLKRHGLTLVGTAGAWFLYDVVIYGLSSFLGEITVSLKLGQTVKDEARNTLLLMSAAIPATLSSIWLVDFLGRKNCQWLGFFGMGTFFGGLTLSLVTFGVRGVPAWAKIAFLILALCCNTAGPGMTTYIIPFECFPTVVKSSFHGFSAASGKLGAVVGALTFAALTNSAQWKLALYCTCICLLGSLWTLFLTPQYTHEDLHANLQEESAAIRAYHASTVEMDESESRES